MINCVGVNNTGCTEIRSVDCGKSKKMFITNAINRTILYSTYDILTKSLPTLKLAKWSQLTTKLTSEHGSNRTKPTFRFCSQFWSKTTRRRSWYENEDRRGTLVSLIWNSSKLCHYTQSHSNLYCLVLRILQNIWWRLLTPP